MAFPFGLGKIIDLMYTSNVEEMKESLKKVSLLLVNVIILIAICNFGRRYLLEVTGIMF